MYSYCVTHYFEGHKKTKPMVHSQSPNLMWQPKTSMDLTVGSKLIALNDEKFALLALVYELHVVAFIENERGGNLEG